jgi:hypothetical protein
MINTEEEVSPIKMLEKIEYLMIGDRRFHGCLLNLPVVNTVGFPIDK